MTEPKGLGFRLLAPKTTALSDEPLRRLSTALEKEIRHHHSEAAWEAQKQTIRHLYLERDETASSVIKLLRTEFKFNTRYCPFPLNPRFLFHYTNGTKSPSTTQQM